jgi:hypothetical protein
MAGLAYGGDVTLARTQQPAAVGPVMSVVRLPRRIHMYCPQCQTPNPLFNKACSKCGHKLPKPGPSQRDPGPLLFFGIACTSLGSAMLIWPNGKTGITGLAISQISLGLFLIDRYRKLKRIQKNLQSNK